MTAELNMIKNLVEIMEAAIRAGDWKVDGACDPDMVLHQAEDMLRKAGYTPPYDQWCIGCSPENCPGGCSTHHSTEDKRGDYEFE